MLGEEVSTEAEAAEIVRGYLEALEQIEHDRLRTGVSVKPTALGLDVGADLCRANLETIVRAAAERGRFVRIDMEDSATTSATLELYRALRATGHDNVGIVLQARLRRTLDDARALADLRPSVRLCKGIYLEPEEVAFQDDREVGERFLEIAETLLDAGCFVAFATHADRLVGQSRLLVAERGLAAGSYEFQLLLGVRADLADHLVAERERVRIYVPVRAAVVRVLASPAAGEPAAGHPGRPRRGQAPGDATVRPGLCGCLEEAVVVGDQFVGADLKGAGEVDGVQRSQPLGGELGCPLEEGAVGSTRKALETRRRPASSTPGAAPRLQARMTSTSAISFVASWPAHDMSAERSRLVLGDDQLDERRRVQVGERATRHGSSCERLARRDPRSCSSEGGASAGTRPGTAVGGVTLPSATS